MTEQHQHPDAHIVVGVDGSESSQRALRWGWFLAQSTGCTLEAVAAWDPAGAYGWATFGMASMPADWDPMGDTRKGLDHAIDGAFGAEPPPTLTRTVREGNAAKVLLEAGRNVRMIVVGNRGHGGFAGLLLGSVSSACVEHAGCPVVVVHGSAEPPVVASAPQGAVSADVT